MTSDSESSGNRHMIASRLGSPRATGTVFRSTRTSPRRAHTTSPVPTYLNDGNIYMKVGCKL